MFAVTCHHCNTRWLVGTRSIRSFHNTSEGPVAHVTCPRGHAVIQHFRDEVTAPEPLAEVS